MAKMAFPSADILRGSVALTIPHVDCCLYDLSEDSGCVTIILFVKEEG